MYGIFSLTGEEHPEPGKNPYNTLIMITDKARAAAQAKQPHPAESGVDGLSPGAGFQRRGQLLWTF